MTAVARLLTRVTLAACLLATVIVPPVHGNGGDAGDANTVGEQAVTRSEVRLRKLHLVRPDLIPYPIAYEVCC